MLEKWVCSKLKGWEGEGGGGESCSSSSSKTIENSLLLPQHQSTGFAIGENDKLGIHREQKGR